MDLFQHKVTIQSILFRNAQAIMGALLGVWKALGIPHYRQFDNLINKFLQTLSGILGG